MNTANPPRNTLHHGMKASNTVIWDVSKQPVDYVHAMAVMESHVSDLLEGAGRERVWLLEHPPLYTGGTRSHKDDLLDRDRFPVHMTGRGGEYTYHGPGQRVAYPILNLAQRVQDLRLYISTLEQWIINTLDVLNVKGERREDRVGVWVVRPDLAPLADGSPREDKIAAIGIRVRKWICFHGISLNVEPDLEHYSGIVSCGVHGHGVTSLVDLGLPVAMEDVDLILKQEFQKLFGPTS